MPANFSTRMATIYHIAARTEWEAACTAGSYTADSLQSEGFIHCSTAQQVVSTANRLFRGRRNLALLCIDTDRVHAEIRYENLGGGASLFPHIYGAIDMNAICAVHAFEPAADGSFALPPA